MKRDGDGASAHLDRLIPIEVSRLDPKDAQFLRAVLHVLGSQTLMFLTLEFVPDTDGPAETLAAVKMLCRTTHHRLFRCRFDLSRTRVTMGPKDRLGRRTVVQRR